MFGDLANGEKVIIKIIFLGDKTIIIKLLVLGDQPKMINFIIIGDKIKMNKKIMVRIQTIKLKINGVIIKIIIMKKVLGIAVNQTNQEAGEVVVITISREEEINIKVVIKVVKTKVIGFVNVEHGILKLKLHVSNVKKQNLVSLFMKKKKMVVSDLERVLMIGIVKTVRSGVFQQKNHVLVVVRKNRKSK